MKDRLISFENRWDILYRDYPEIYDEFANVPYKPRMIDVLHEKFDINRKLIEDVGSGSGRSTIQLARYAEQVIGVEPEKSMRGQAKKNTEELGIDNIVYIDSRAEEIPLDNDLADMVVAVTATMYPPEDVIPKFIKEAQRVTKPGGTVISVDVAPGWYGGELADIIDDPDADIYLMTKHNVFVEKAGFSFLDVEQTSYYGSLEKITSTYGFISGKKAIDHIKKNKVTSIKWTFRVYYSDNI
jgi:ubiquinone/menaquinone biosynthesis C-methylase UbiE